MIDIHTHLHPKKLYEAISKWFLDHANFQFNHPSDPYQVSNFFKAHDIERFVFFSYAHRQGMSEELNAWLATTAKNINYHGLPLATVHPDDANPLEDLKIAIDAGCIGLKIHEDVQKIEIDDLRLTKCFEMLEEINGFVVAHIGPIPWKIPKGLELARVTNVLERYPKLNFVVAHLGSPNTKDYCSLFAKYPKLHLDTTLCFAKIWSDKLPLSKEEMEKYADHIIYGSDYPTIPQPYLQEKENIESMQLSSATKEKIFRTNALKLIKPFLPN